MYCWNAWRDLLKTPLHCIFVCFSTATWQAVKQKNIKLKLGRKIIEIKTRKCCHPSWEQLYKRNPRKCEDSSHQNIERKPNKAKTNEYMEDKLWNGECLPSTCLSCSSMADLLLRSCRTFRSAVVSVFTCRSYNRSEFPERMKDCRKKLKEWSELIALHAFWRAF